MKQKDPMTKAAAYMGLVFVIPAAMFALWWLGDYFDERFGTSYLSTCGLLVGFAAGLFEVMRQANRIEKK